jgi:hypothetical protein
MGRQKWLMALMWLVVVVILIWASFSILDALSKYAPPIIAALASIYVAMLNHALTQQREIQLQHQKEKQNNYENLLKVVCDLIRDPNNKDIWDTIHLYSWVVGSNDVVRKTQEFSEKKDEESLKSLLVSMRNDIGLEKIDSDLEPKVFEERKEGFLKRSENDNKKRFSFWPN